MEAGFAGEARGCRLFPLDAPELETRIMGEPGAGWSPEKAYDRQWALVVLGRVLDQLEAEMAVSGRQKLFAVLKPCLVGEDDEGSYAEMATRLEMTPGNVKVTVHRLRQQFRDLLKQEIARTVNEPALVEEEIRHLIPVP
jgi:RNA polymerase sigma-70 factor (ECF subfamily)